MPVRRIALLALTAAAVLTAGAVPASAAPNPGRVVAFVGDFLPLQVWDDPTGCNTLPAGTHVVFNDTDRTIVVYADPLCLVPSEPMSRLAAGHSMHVSSVGSFQA